MSLTKIDFADKSVEVFKINHDGEDWMTANAFAEALNYSNVNRAIRVHVAENNQKTLEELRSDRSSGLIASSLHPQTKFINRAGVVELLMRSQMKYARQFRYWLASVKLNVDEDDDAVREFNEWRLEERNARLLDSLTLDDRAGGAGVVYVLTNRLLRMIDAYKIGFTHDLGARVAELNVASPFDFEVVFTREATEPRALEQKLHSHFNGVRIKREFFKLSAEDLALMSLLCDRLLALNA